MATNIPPHNLREVINAVVKIIDNEVEQDRGTDIEELLDIVKGAFSIGDKYCAFYGADGDMVRITGYLVKKSDLEKYDAGNVVLQDNVINGSSNYKLNRLKDRKVRNV